jgi:NTP pyrophosphatase (non-canonical NTP hydrolase)
MQLDEFVAAIRRIYSEPDSKRSIWDVWLHTNHHAAAIGEQVRRGTAGRELLTEIADFAMWLFTTVHKLQGEIGVRNSPAETPQGTLIRVAHGYSDLLWNRYPGLCPVCYWRRTEGDRAREESPAFSNACDCLLYDVETRDQSQRRRHAKALRGFSHDKRDRKPRGVDEWQDMFAKVFAANLRHLSLTDIAFHLLEEVGEVSDAMVRMYTYLEEIAPGEPSWRQIWLEDELADVSSWLFTLVEKLDCVRQTADEHDRWVFGTNVVERRHIPLSRIIWKRYGSNELEDFMCPHPPPQLRVCTCPILIVPYDREVKEVQDRLQDVLAAALG